jgi:hypothetical protein
MQPIITAMFRFIYDVIDHQRQQMTDARKRFNADPSVLLGWIDAPGFRETRAKYVRRFTRELKRFASLDGLMRQSTVQPDDDDIDIVTLPNQEGKRRRVTSPAPASAVNDG